MGNKPELFILHTCPFSWKLRSLLQHIGLDYEEVQVNPLKIKKQLAFSDGWNKVPVWRDSDGTVLVDSTPMMKELDAKYNSGKLMESSDDARRDEW
jgi:glutathione S-transferase